MFSPDVERWLEAAGYEHHCFISYPRIRNVEMQDCAKRVRDSIEKDLSYVIDSPKVFLDDHIPGGADWEARLRQSLCRSISMIALCSPMYFHPMHRWCGLEWAAMDHLSALRLPGKDFRTIIPLIVRESAALPQAVSKIQYIDISRVTLKGRRYYNTNEYRSRIRDVVDRIGAIAIAIAEAQVVTDCDAFTFPATSAFTHEPSPAESRSFWSTSR